MTVQLVDIRASTVGATARLFSRSVEELYLLAGFAEDVKRFLFFIVGIFGTELLFALDCRCLDLVVVPRCTRILELVLRFVKFNEG